MPCERCDSYREQGWEQCLKCNSKLAVANSDVDVHKKAIIDNYTAQCCGNLTLVNSISAAEPLFISRWEANVKPIVHTKSEIEDLYPILRHYADWDRNVVCSGPTMGVNKNIVHLLGDRKTSPDGRPVLVFKHGNKTCILSKVCLDDLALIGKAKKERVVELLAECIGLQIADDAKKGFTSDEIKSIQRMQAMGQGAPAGKTL